MAKPKNKNKRMPSQVTPAVMPKAPVPEALNKFGGNQRYIENLYVPGNRDYQSQYGGGGWVATKGTPGVDAISDQELRNYNKAFAYLDKTTGGKAAIQPLGGEELINRYSGEYDKMAAQGAFGGTTSPAASPAATSYKDLKSINQGLKLGGDNILGRREAMKIARGTGKGYDDVIARALGQGMSIGGGAVRQSNRASGTSQLTPTIKGQQMFTSGGSDDPLSAMRRVTPGRRQMYSGTYQLDGQTMPLVESRRGGVASTLGGMTAGGGRRGGKGKGRGRRGRGGASDMGGADMGTMPQTPMTPMEPMTPEQMAEASTIDINMPGVGENVFSSATGFRSKRSSRKRAGSMAQGLASQRINPTGSWSYRI